MSTLTHTPAYTISHPDSFTDEAGNVYYVGYDTDCETPAVGLDDVEIIPFRGSRGFHLPSVESQADSAFSRAFARYYEQFDAYDAANIAARYVRAFLGTPAPEYLISTVHESSQSDWRDVLVIVHDEGYGNPEGWLAEYRQWLEGSVYWVSTAEDSLSGIYADSMEEAVTFYVENYA